jgi:capsular polysaccharide biosynthesis protein
MYQVTLRFAAGLPPEQTPGVYNYDRQYAWLASEYLANGLSDIVHTSLFAQNVANRANINGLNLTPDQVQAALSSDQKQSIMEVYLTWNNAAQAVQIGQAISDELTKNGTSYWPQLSAATGAPVVTLDKPVPVPIAVSLRDRFDVPVRILVALVAGVALTLLAHLLDPYLHDRYELERMGVQVIGRIPR